jgi:hypothetical protein
MMYVGTAFLPGWLVDLEGRSIRSFAPHAVLVDLMRVLITILAAGGALLAPQAAGAATIEALGPCYRSVDAETRQTVPVKASGFTPGARVNVYIDGRVVQENVTVLSEGQIEGGVSAPYQASGERPFTLTVTQVGQPSNTASTSSRVAALALRLKPRKAKPSRRVRFLGRGFIDGTEVFAHYVRKGKLRKTVSLGAPKGPCGRVSVKRRQIPVADPALGRWTLQVDNQQTYSAEPPSVFTRLTITVTRALPASGR